MNQALGDQVAKIIASAGSACASASAFVQERAPELCRQIVAWELWSNAAYAGLAFIALFLLALVLYVAYKKNFADGYAAIALFSAVGLMFAVSAVREGLYGCVKPLCAPDLVVLDYVRAFVK